MAEIYKMIVNQPDGIQEIIEVYKGGGYYDDAKVIYDEAVSGPMSQDIIDKVGGWKLDAKDNLVFDKDLFDANTALVLAKAKKAKFQELDDKVEEAIQGHYGLFKIIRVTFELATGLGGDDKDIYDMVKAHIVKYDQFKALITAAKDLAALDAIVIDFSDVTW